MLGSDLRALQESYQAIYEETDGISCEMIEEVVEELVEECIEFGYTLDEAVFAVEEAAILYIDEAKVTYGSDTESPEQRRERAKAKVGEKRAAARKTAVKTAVGRAKAKVSGAKAAVGIAASIAKDEARRAGRKAVHGVKHSVEKKKQEVKSGIKGFLGKAARKVASKASSAAARLGEAVYGGTPATPAKPKDTRYTVTAADKKGNTKAYQNYKAGDKRYKAADHLGEEQIDEAGKAFGGGEDPCWKGYKQVGMKKKNGKEVPNCVPTTKKEELEATGLFSEKEIEAILEAQMNEGIIDAAKAGSKRHQDAMKGASRAIKKAGIRTKKLGKALAPAADTAKSAASGVAKAAKATYAAGEKTGAFVKKGAQRHNDMMKAAKKVFSKEELDLIAQIMIDEGFDISDYTLEEFHTLCVDAEMLDENRAAARAAGGYKDDSKKQTDPSKPGFTGISGSIKDIMRQNKEIEARNKKK